MDSDSNEHSVTAQGRDTPVPVGEGGARAGSPQPSSCDCSGLSVDNQVETRGMATGVGMEKETSVVGWLASSKRQQEELKAFGRSPKIARSPVKGVMERETVSGNAQQGGDKNAEVETVEIDDEAAGYTSAYQEESGPLENGGTGIGPRTGGQAGARSKVNGERKRKKMPAAGSEMEKKMVACFSAMTGAAGSCGDVTMGAKLKRKFGKDIGGLRTWGSAPSSPNNSVLDLTFDEDEALLITKKKATGDEIPFFDRPGLEGSGALACKVRDTIKKIDKEVRAVADVAARERNTKKEIKEGALVLKKLLSTMMSGEVQEFLQLVEKSGDKGDEPTPQELNLVDRLEILEGRIRKLEDSNRALCEENIHLKAELGKSRPADKEMVSRVARLEQELKDLKANNRRLKEENARLRSERAEVREEMVTHERIKACKTKEAWQELEKLQWPEKIYTAVFTVNGSLLSSNVDADLLVLEEDGLDAEFNRDLREHFDERFPELKFSSEDLLAATVCTTYKDGQGANKTNLRHIFRMSARDAWYDTMARVKDIMMDKREESWRSILPGRIPSEAR